MNSWKSCLVSDINSDAFKEDSNRTEDYSAFENEFIDWMIKSSYYGGKLDESEFSLPFGNYHRFAVDCYSSSLNRRFQGIGRSENRLTAVSKAFGEALERIVAFDVMREDLEPSHSVTITNGDTLIKRFNDKQPVCILPKELRTSNGWAIHFDVNIAIRSSIFESIERHILLLTFLKDNWSGFYYNDSPSFQGINLRSLLSKYSIGGFSAGMCLSQTNGHGGITMGYLSDSTKNIATSEGWKKSFFESVEQALHFKMKKAEPDPRAVEYGYRDIEKNQLYYLVNNYDHNENTAFENLVSTSITSIFDVANTNLMVFDVQKKMGLNFPMFAAYTFGGDMIPLFFSEASNNFDARSYILAVIRKNRLPEIIPQYHPIL